MPFDIIVLEGIRSPERQKQLVAEGKSKTMNSRHLTGDAVDLAPYPIDWNDKKRFEEMASHMLAASKLVGVRITWGGDWNENGRSDDEKFYDGPHFQLHW